MAVTAREGQSRPCNSSVARVKELLSPATHPSLPLVLLTLGSHAGPLMLDACTIKLQRLSESQGHR